METDQNTQMPKIGSIKKWLKIKVN